MRGRAVIILLFLAVLMAPLLFRNTAPTPARDAATLIIITPHNEQIRSEFEWAFNAWHLREYGSGVDIQWSIPGGTSEIRKMLVSQYAASLRKGEPVGGSADLVFGGGSHEHAMLRKGVEVMQDGEIRAATISVPLDFDAEWLAARYGKTMIGGVPLHDPELYWFGTALSGFGIMFNRDCLRDLDIEEPYRWADLCRPELRGWIAMVNPGQSGSITTAFESILRYEGWSEGWAILRRSGANARTISATSIKSPADVSRGDAAMGICIDFYGRYQSQELERVGSGDRVGYVDPPGASTIDPDPVSVLRGAPHPGTARHFVEFCLADEGQALWQFPARKEGRGEGELHGPLEFELRRLPICHDFYRRHADRMIDEVNPFDLVGQVVLSSPAIRSFITPLFQAMVMESRSLLQEAWQAIVSHPAYPPGGGIVSQDMVTDPQLREMLLQFDAMPGIPGPGGLRYSLSGTEDLETLKNGWLRGRWDGERDDRGRLLWDREDTPADAFRRRCAVFFRARYKQILDLAGGEA